MSRKVKKSKFNKDVEKVLLSQDNQLSSAKNNSRILSKAIHETKESICDNSSELYRINVELDILLQQEGLPLHDSNESNLSEEGVNDFLEISETKLETIRKNSKIEGLIALDTISTGNNWDEYINNVQQYAKDNNVDLNVNPFEKLLSPQQRLEIEERLKEEYSFKRAHCDKYDYIIAATCGVLGGIIDIFFVGLPGEGAIGKFTDTQVNKTVEKVAGAFGWNGPREGSDSTKSAIGFLESKFPVNYDQRHTGDVGGGIFNVSKQSSFEIIGAFSQSHRSLLFYFESIYEYSFFCFCRKIYNN